MSKTKTFQYVTNSNSAPAVSDTESGFVEGDDAMSALWQVVSSYKHPAGLYSAVIRLPIPSNPTVATYLSSEAATSVDAGCGLHHYEDDVLYVDGEPVDVKPERYEGTQ